VSEAAEFDRQGRASAECGEFAEADRRRSRRLSRGAGLAIAAALSCALWALILFGAWLLFR
jgi:hypothetical protein